MKDAKAVAARPAPSDELNVDELLGALDVLYRASHEHALEGHPWQRPNRARTVIDVWLRASASSLAHVKEVLYGGVMEAAARIAGPAPPALARPAWRPIAVICEDCCGRGWIEVETGGPAGTATNTCPHCEGEGVVYLLPKSSLVSRFAISSTNR